jgi:hypothetical protein
MATFFNEYFDVTTNQVDDYGAFNVSIINDLSPIRENLLCVF